MQVTADELNWGGQDERYCEKLNFCNERCYRRFEDWWYKKQYKCVVFV
jgi:hypothetical protein